MSVTEDTLMNERTFKEFIDKLIAHFQENYRIDNDNIQITLAILNQLRINKNKEMMNGYVKIANDNPKPSTLWNTACNWFPGCIPYMIIATLVVFLIFLPLIIAGILTFYCFW